ncbi:MAG TPA: substrate-binding domain-containing protein [Mycobacteriales bacterium]|jgi:molybdate/tungstate transport system substrate-binding protein|nr:substrate-binding domain-containing protein [Mycobacteriales bacterium]
MTRPVAGSVVAILGFVIALAGCGGHDRPTAHVLYAGSLVNLMERQIGPGFAHASGDGYQGYGAASRAIANAIKADVKTGDVFVAASPSVNDTLTGRANGTWVRWYASFGTAPLVLAYSPSSRYADDLRTRRWVDVLTEPGIRVGITDPVLDPKGKLTVTALDAAQRAYGLPRTFASSVRDEASVFPEEDLLGRLQAGQLDVGFFYTSEAVPAHLRTVPLGRVHEAATYTVTLLERAADATAGIAFVRYLLTAARPALAAGGVQVQTPTLHGDRAAVPAALRTLLAG